MSGAAGRRMGAARRRTTRAIAAVSATVLTAALAAVLATALTVLSGCAAGRVRVPPAPPGLARTDVALVAHRGGAATAPENTLAAAEACLELGVAYVEVDVRTARDGTLFLLHDATVDRTTDGSGRLRELDAGEVEALDAGAWFARRFAGERVPRLDAFLAWARGRIRVYLDVKDADPAAVIAAVRGAGMAADCLFGFGGPADTRRFRELAPDLALKVVAGRAEVIRELAAILRPAVVEIPPERLAPDAIAACREQGIAVMIPIFGRDHDAYARALAWGPDLLNLDDPAAFRRLQR